jgi:hypothetical protein
LNRNRKLADNNKKRFNQNRNQHQHDNDVSVSQG